MTTASRGQSPFPRARALGIVPLLLLRGKSPFWRAKLAGTVPFLLLLFTQPAYPLTVSLTANPPSAVGGSDVVFSATATGGSGNYLYKWWRLALYNEAATVAWVPVQDWSANNQYLYNTPVGGGRQRVVVWVKNAGSPAEYETYAVRDLTIAPAPLPQCGPIALSGFGGAMSNLDGLHYLPIAGKAYTAGSYPFPFVVPPGKFFDVSSVHVYGKVIDGVDAVGVIFNNFFTVSGSRPLLFPTPLRLPAGTVLDGYFSNGSTSEPMNVMLLLVGHIVCGY